VIFHIRMAWHSLMRSRGLTAVMIAALSLAIATWYVQHQIFAFLMAKFPYVPAHAFHIALERGERAPAGRPSHIAPLLSSILLTPRDAHGVLDGVTTRHTMTFSSQALLEPEGYPAETAQVRYATRDLFSLFAIPIQGAPFANDDEAVIDERLARRLFGKDAIGRHLRVDGIDVRIVGIAAASHDDRYHLYERIVPRPDAIYLPISRGANAQPNFEHVVAGGESGFVTAWVELPTDAHRTAFVARVEQYLANQSTAGRGFAPDALTLRSGDEWKRAFAPGGTINIWPLLSALCVAAAILNLIRMLMAKFASRSYDLGLLRAFGARRRAVMGQVLLEAVLIGVIACGCGLVIGIATMPLASSTLEQSVPGSPETISIGGVLAALAASIGAALISALYPAWWLTRGTPATQMRSR
jgi:putative ABC transport system permease protein